MLKSQNLCEFPAKRRNVARLEPSLSQTSSITRWGFCCSHPETFWRNQQSRKGQRVLDSMSEAVRPSAELQAAALKPKYNNQALGSRFSVLDLISWDFKLNVFFAALRSFKAAFPAPRASVFSFRLKRRSSVEPQVLRRETTGSRLMFTAGVSTWLQRTSRNSTPHSGLQVPAGVWTRDEVSGVWCSCLAGMRTFWKQFENLPVHRMDGMICD